MQTLSQRAMLASLHITRWPATRTDQKITQEVADNHSVDAKRAGKYRKHVINTDSPTYRAVAQAAGEMRERHYWLTLPWAQNGARILTATGFDSYSAEMRKLRAKFDAAVADFISDYPALIKQAKKELNGMFNAADYPPDIAKCFGIDLKIFPLPDAEDFRAELPAAEVANIRADITAELQRTTVEAMREPYKRLFDHVSKMAERLKQPDPVIRETMISGLAEICAVLPALNLTGDTLLADMGRAAEAMISGVSAEQLRTSPDLRSTVAGKAAEIQDLMGAYMGVQS